MVRLYLDREVVGVFMQNLIEICIKIADLVIDFFQEESIEGYLKN